jgi:hypothetical protein
MSAPVVIPELANDTKIGINDRIIGAKPSLIAEEASTASGGQPVQVNGFSSLARAPPASNKA